MHNLSESAIARPHQVEIFNRDVGSQSPKEECAMYALNVCAYPFHMYQRGY
ncbi:hypothetical protein [Candidatus Nitrosocosmicus arcticus]|uniref:Uncharacterized protein n=1 Tax=Candidatus Nitrosocosmicus arcticus TaxID=2035267 RepID=A0A557SRQ8_9ARCH|nr:hypothetical protein [Candidatus Nitrosocosmicus arcticus]TVP39292.1 hypothetical protein NARC_160005 [Candidatus Nitrosocosmicus arcticus]